jgi:hypothetical protein
MSNQPRSTQFAIRADRLAFVLVLYAWLSALAFAATSGGWSMFTEFFGTGEFYGVFIILFLASNSFRLRRKIIRVDIWFIVLILIAQCWALLMNIGDCGDASGSYTFLQRMLTPQAICTSSAVAPASIAPLIYVMLLIVFLFVSGTKSHRIFVEERVRPLNPTQK